MARISLFSMDVTYKMYSTVIIKVRECSISILTCFFKTFERFVLTEVEVELLKPVKSRFRDI